MIKKEVVNWFISQEYIQATNKNIVTNTILFTHPTTRRNYIIDNQNLSIYNKKDDEYTNYKFKDLYIHNNNLMENKLNSIVCRNDK
jgi:hypothetical protein